MMSPRLPFGQVLGQHGLQTERHAPQASHIRGPLTHAAVQPPPSLRPEYGCGAVESGRVRDRHGRGLGHHAGLDDVHRLGERASHQGGRDADDDVLRYGRLRHVADVVPPRTTPAVPSDRALQRVPRRERRDDERHVPGHRGPPPRVESRRALRPPYLGHGIPEAPVHPRHETLLHDFLRYREDAASRRAERARGQRSEMRLEQAAKSELRRAGEERDGARLEASVQEGPSADVGKSAAVACLGEGPEGVEGVQRRLRKGAGSAAGEGPIEPAATTDGDCVAHVVWRRLRPRKGEGAARVDDGVAVIIVGEEEDRTEEQREEEPHAERDSHGVVSNCRDDQIKHYPKQLP